MASASIVHGPHLLLCGDIFGVLHVTHVAPGGKNCTEVPCANVCLTVHSTEG